MSLFAFIYQTKGFVTEAEACADKAVSLALKHVGISPEQVAIVYNAQGRVLLTNSRYIEAANSFRESLNWAIRAHGMDHPFTGRAMFHLAEVYLAESRTDLAQPLLIKGLQIVDRALGPGSVASSEALEDLGRLYTLDGKFSQAQQVFDQALTIEERAFGVSKPRLVSTLHRCAAVRVYTNKNQDALTYLSRAIEIARAIPWLQSRAAILLRDRAFVENRMGRIEEAEHDYQRAIAGMEAAFGTMDQRLLGTLQDYASLLRKARQPGLKDLDQRIKVLQAACRSTSRTGAKSVRNCSPTNRHEFGAARGH
jgi:tetratricopeptide (TPR) repeat protein